MTPLLSPREVAAARLECDLALAQAQQLCGIERHKLLRKAFPFAVNVGPAEGGLRVTWSRVHNAFAVCDNAGFLTLFREEEIPDLLEAIRGEARQAGTLRQRITGERPAPRRLAEPTKLRPRPEKISLADLGLLGPRQA